MKAKMDWISTMHEINETHTKCWYRNADIQCTLNVKLSMGKEGHEVLNATFLQAIPLKLHSK
jgi:hypothetical protein